MTFTLEVLGSEGRRGRRAAAERRKLELTSFRPFSPPSQLPPSRLPRFCSSTRPHSLLSPISNAFSTRTTPLLPPRSLPSVFVLLLLNRTLLPQRPLSLEIPTPNPDSNAQHPRMVSRRILDQWRRRRRRGGRRGARVSSQGAPGSPRRKGTTSPRGECRLGGSSGSLGDLGSTFSQARRPSGNNRPHPLLPPVPARRLPPRGAHPPSSLFERSHQGYHPLQHLRLVHLACHTSHGSAGKGWGAGGEAGGEGEDVEGSFRVGVRGAFGER